MIEAFRSFSPDAEAAVDQFIEAGGTCSELWASFGSGDAIRPTGRRCRPTDLIVRTKLGHA